MTKSGKDSAEVIEFMRLFSQLKNWADDDAEGLIDFAANDESVKALCSELHIAAWLLRKSERRRRMLFAAPVDPSFVTEWRDYEERYEPIMWKVMFPEPLEPTSEMPEDFSSPRSVQSQADLNWDFADDEAFEQASNINDAIEFAQFNIDQEHRHESFGADHVRRIEDGLEAWSQFCQETGFDLRGVLRRRALVPFVLVPRTVSAKHGSEERLSMINNLQQAHNAFVFGATYAAIGLMRSIMESVLRDHYHASGKDLHDRIRNARGLPAGANEGALHRLRKLANAILHLDKERDEGLPKLNENQVEKEILSLLYALRALIEGAKS